MASTAPGIPAGSHEPPAPSTASAPALWPAALWQWASSVLVTREQRWGLFAAGLVVAVMAESLSFVVASSYYANDLYVSRFTGLSHDPFKVGPVPIPYPEHRLRLLGPVIAWVMGLEGVTGTFVPIAANLPLLALVYTFVRPRTSVPMALAATLLLATTHLTMTSRTLLGYHDSLVYLCCMGVLVARHHALRAALLFLALYGDVRAVLICPLVVIWPTSHEQSMPRLGPALTRTLVCGVAVGLWVLSAGLLLDILQYEQAASGRLALYLDGTFLEEIELGWLHLSAFMTFKSAWLFALVALWETARRSRAWGAYLVVASLGIAIPSILVHDVSRALGFFFPVILLGLVDAWRRSPAAAQIAVGVCLVVNLVTPFYHGFTFDLWEVSYPLPVELLRP